jgi:hypothetical protein
MQATLFHRESVDGLAATATISACGTYRYSLERATGIVGPNIAWLMINPSTATAEKDDHTIRKVIGFSRRAGYGVALVVNLFAWRTKDVRDLRTNLADAEGEENCRAIMEATAISDGVVCAWGPKRWAYEQAEQTLLWLAGHPAGPRRLLCVGTAKDGAPLHPLFVPYENGLQPFTRRPFTRGVTRCPTST